MNAAFDLLDIPYTLTPCQQWLHDHGILQRMQDIARSICCERSNRHGRLCTLDIDGMQTKRAELTKLTTRLSQLEIDLLHEDFIDRELVSRIGQYADFLYAADLMTLTLSEEILAVCCLLYDGDAVSMHYRTLEFCADAEVSSGKKLTCISPRYSRLVRQFTERPHAATWFYTILQHS
jgi:hypothetical protein